MTPVTWSEAAALSEDYALILHTEMDLHSHELVKDSHGTLRWKADPLIDEMFSRRWFNLNDIMLSQYKPINGANPKIPPNPIVKNDPLARELYRRMGISLFGYWEVFYWDVNNPNAEEFNK